MRHCFTDAMKKTLYILRPDMSEPPPLPVGGKSFGLGDAVEIIAKPVAAGIDALFHTNIKNCGGCAKRKDAFNKAVPNLNPFVDNKK